MLYSLGCNSRNSLYGKNPVNPKLQNSAIYWDVCDNENKYMATTETRNGMCKGIY